MARSPLELRLIEALEVAAAGRDIDVVDVEVAGGVRSPRVCVRIDHAAETSPTITLDEVGEQSAWIDAVVEGLDPVEGSYTLEISSPGLDRPLRRARDFERFAGVRVTLTTTATQGRRRYTGTLGGLVDGNVVITCDDGEFSCSLEEIDSCKIKPDFGSSAKGDTRPKKGQR